MDEDVAGLSRVRAGNEYGACARCGAPVRTRRAPAARARGSGEAQTLCQRCYRDVVAEDSGSSLTEQE